MESSTSTGPRQRVVFEPFACPPALVCRRAAACTAQDISAAVPALGALPQALCASGTVSGHHEAAASTPVYAQVARAVEGLRASITSLGGSHAGSVLAHLEQLQGSSAARLGSCKAGLSSASDALREAHRSAVAAHGQYRGAVTDPNSAALRDEVERLQAQVDSQCVH